MGQERGEIIPFLNVLRGPAALLVVWSHLVALFSDSHHLTPALLTFARNFINAPLGIILDFGWLGVCLFFLISGFIISHVSQRETRREFMIKRLFRIYPLLALAVLISLALQPALWGQASLSNIFLNVSLLNYFFVPQVLFLNVAWTLVIEIMFYVLVLFLYPLRSRPSLLTGAELGIVFLILSAAHAFGDSFFLFAAATAYLPYLIVGQLFYFGLYMKRLHLGAMVALLALSAMALVKGLQEIHVQFLSAHHSYLISFGWVVVIFLFFLLINRHLHVGKTLAYLAETSYGIYLLHNSIGATVLKILFPSLGYYRALAVAIISVFVVVSLVYYLYEKPLLRLGHKLAARASSVSA